MEIVTLTSFFHQAGLTFFNISGANFRVKNYVLPATNPVPFAALIPIAMKNAEFRVPLVK